MGWNGANCEGRTHAVGSLKANAFGLFDVHGNVWEWTLDGWDPTYYGQFTAHSAVNPWGSSAVSTRHAVRGGFWATPEPRCIASRRFFQPSTERYSHNGFRVVLPIKAVKRD